MFKLVTALGLVVVFPLSGSAQSAQQPLPTPLINGPIVAPEAVVDTTNTTNAPLQDDAVHRAFFGAYLRVDAGLVAPTRPAYNRDFSFAGTTGALPEPSNGTYSVADWHPVSASTLAFRGDFAELRRFDIAGGARLSFLVAGVSYSQSAPVLSWEGSAEVPYPFRPEWRRSVAAPGVSAPAKHRVFRLDVGATVPLGRRVELAVFGGPAMHSLSYSSPSDLRFAFEYPFETATGQSLVQGPATASTIGYHAAADVGFYPVSPSLSAVLLSYCRISSLRRQECSSGTTNARKSGNGSVRWSSCGRLPAAGRRRARRRWPAVRFRPAWRCARAACARRGAGRWR